MYLKEVPGRAWLEISLANLRWNYRTLCGLMRDGCRCMAVVKADAYGHGAVRVARTLQDEGCDFFAVATLEEALALRMGDIGGEILILGYTMPRDAFLLHRYDLIQTAVDEQHARELAESGFPVKVHLAVNTGMNRLGISCRDTEAILRVLEDPRLRVLGVYSHMGAADGKSKEDIAYTRMQVEEFLTLREILAARGYGNLDYHMQSSSGIFFYPMEGMRYARPGIALYGCASERGENTGVCLKPMLQMKSRVECVRTVGEGEYVSYARGYRAASPRRIAAVSIGYADGLPRSLSGCGNALIKGRRVPIAGRVCMDQTMLDVTGVSDVREGDIVTFIGMDGAEKISAEELAQTAGTITNELLSRLGVRLTKTYTE